MQMRLIYVVAALALGAGVEGFAGPMNAGHLRRRGLAVMRQQQPPQSQAVHRQLVVPSEEHSWGKRVWRGATGLGRWLMPIVLPVCLVYLISVCPASAKAKAVAVAVTEGATKKRRKKGLFRRLMEGVNADSSILQEVGDTRSEFSAVVNSFSTVIILAALSMVAFVLHKKNEIVMGRAETRELEKIKEYKENMYFEAVETILEKLADPKLKGSTKANLQKQLKDLDPDGVIKKFVEEKGERPDISYLTDRKKKAKKSADKFSSIAERKPAKKSTGGAAAKTPPPAAKKTVKGQKGVIEDDDDEGGEEDDLREGLRGDDEQEESEAEAQVEEKVVPAAKRTAAPTPRPAAAASTSDFDDEDDDRSDPETHLVVLNELFDSLQGVLPNKQRKFLVEYLKAKIDAVADPAKREAVVVKIAQKLGADEYWVNYSKNLEEGS